jgi:type III restriction enzyme
MFDEPKKRNLLDKVDIYWEDGNISEDVSDYVRRNLNPNFEIRPYQVEALARLRYVLNHKVLRQKPTQLLFEMATGSGKTLVMAGAILELYEQGYRNFIFFVNRKIIVEKTKDNFLNQLSRKYLFAPKLQMNFKLIEIEEVSSFESGTQDNIHILFTTINGLHDSLKNVKENSISIDDFKDKKIVLLSDEAHHINAETKNSKEDDLSKYCWETTVNDILKSNPENVLLEFTATAELTNKEIAAKYQDKLLFKYDLARFRHDKFSKDVNILQADMPTMDRALLAVLLSQYRKKVYNAHANSFQEPIKPVILMKSADISSSKNFQIEFQEKIKNLQPIDIENLRNNKSDTIMQTVFAYFDSLGLRAENLITEIQQDFGYEFCLSVNSKEEANDKQLAVNDLENPKNLYRVIFAVDKLNEGWDVLNLFDIVRLYETRDSGKGKLGKTTISEAQLIGRGTRYFPFQITAEQEKYKRKYDNDLENPLRILEQLHYHSRYDSRYVAELQAALRSIGLLDEKELVKRTMNVKDSFTETEVYKSGFLFVNRQIEIGKADFENPASPSKSASYGKPVIKTQHHFTVSTGISYERQAFDGKMVGEQKIISANWYFNSAKKLHFDTKIVRKAMQVLEFYKIENLQRYYPKMESWTEILSEFSQVEVSVTGAANVIQNLPNPEQYRIVLEVLKDISENLNTEYGNYRGSTDFSPKPIREIVKNKVLHFAQDSAQGETGVSIKDAKNRNLRTDLSLSDYDWYVYDDCFGTSKEKFLIKFIDSQLPELRKKYQEIYLFRNERDFKLYNFNDGKAFEPDFVLFLAKKAAENSEKTEIAEMQYHFYIEPKGEYLAKHDAWKEEFLLAIQSQSTVMQYANKHFQLIGLPFYNHENQGMKAKFEGSFEQAIIH